MVQNQAKKIITGFSLGVISIGAGKAEYGPYIDDYSNSEKLPVDEWWNQVVWRLMSGAELSRRSIVLTAANQDGGAHIDSKLEPGYNKLATKTWGNLVVKKGEKIIKDQNVINMHQVAMRTMGNELLKSPELLGLLP